MRAAPGLAGARHLARAFEQHCAETRDHEHRVRERLHELGAGPSMFKDLAGRAGATPMLLFARLQRDTPGKLTAHAYSYEHMEVAAYELLEQAALAAGDEATAELARSIRAEEEAMAQRLESCFDEAVAASVAGLDERGLAEALAGYLADAHAIEQQSVRFLEVAVPLVRVDALESAMREHLRRTRAQAERVERCLAADEDGPSRVKDAVMRLGGVNVAMFQGSQPDAPVKLAGFAFAFEHLEVAGYELLARTAARAGRADVVELAKAVAQEEREAAAVLRAGFPAAMDRVLAARAEPRAATPS
jgi:ferritin-like metal-binding protein YciE